MEREP